MPQALLESLRGAWAVPHVLSVAVGQWGDPAHRLWQAEAVLRLLQNPLGVSSAAELAPAPSLVSRDWFLFREEGQRQAGWAGGRLEGLWPVLPAGPGGAVRGGACWTWGAVSGGTCHQALLCPRVSGEHVAGMPSTSGSGSKVTFSSAAMA